MKIKMISRMDEAGRIVIPKSIRARVDITNKTPVIISTKGDRIYLEKCEKCEHIEGIRNVYAGIAEDSSISSSKKQKIRAVLDKAIDIMEVEG